VAWNKSQKETEKSTKYTQEFRSNMRYDTTLGDDNTTKELVQFFIVADG